MRPIGHTANTVKSTGLAMGAVLAGQLEMGASWELEQMVCCMDGIDCQTAGSTVALDKCAEVTDASEANQPWLDSTSIPALKLCEFSNAATDLRMLKIVFHNTTHRRQSNYKRMAFVRRQPTRPTVRERMPVTSDERKMISMQNLPMRRIVCIRSSICQLDAELERIQCRMDLGNRAIRCRSLRAFSFGWHNSNRDSSKPL